MADTSSTIKQRPKKRIEPVLPLRRELKFHDGLPKSNPADTLRRIVRKVQQERYTYVPLGPGEDIRVLILEPGRPADPSRGQEADPIRCKLVPTSLPSLGDSSPRDTIPYEALSYFWGLDPDNVSINIASLRDQSRFYNVVVEATKASAAKRRVDAPALSQLEVASVIQKKFWIRPNLHAALLQLRHPTEETKLWIDAICINQEDSVEKTAQVSRMHQIYSNAENVCIWLGVGIFDPVTNIVEPEATRRVYDFIRDMLDLQHLDQLVQEEKCGKDWLAFVQLMRNRWFSRRWVVQELALAREATVHYGKEVILWEDFADAVALFVTKHDQINALLKRSGSVDPIGDIRVLGANTLVEATRNLFRRSKDGKVMERLKTLEMLVSTLLPFEATDPRDIVYGVLSIAKDTPYSDSTTAAEMSASVSFSSPAEFASLGRVDHRITPNYAKSPAHIFTDFVAYCVDKSQSLDIICRHWAPVLDSKKEALSLDTPSSMPTWVSSITGSAFGSPEAALQGRSNGDSLVGSSSSHHRRNYNASAGLRAFAEFLCFDLSSAGDLSGNEEEGWMSAHGQEPVQGRSRSASMTSTSMKPKNYNDTLVVRGMRLDTIGKLSPRAAEGMILHECLNMAGWSYGSPLKEVEDSLWQTLVADRGPDGISAPCWYRRACLSCLARVTQSGDLNTDALMANAETPSTMVAFLKRVQQVVWNRKFLRSTGGLLGQKDKELLGLAPRTAEEGDHICIIFGCSVPVILREIRFQGEVYFKLVGEAYIHGMMDGEALSGYLPEHPYEDSDSVETFRIL